MTKVDLAIHYSSITRRERIKAFERAASVSTLSATESNYCYDSSVHNNLSGNEMTKEFSYDAVSENLCEKESDFALMTCISTNRK